MLTTIISFGVILALGLTIFCTIKWWNLPLTGVYVGGEINAIEYDGSGMRDFDAHIGWQSDFLLGVKAGYSRLEVELDDVSGLDSDLEIGGPYLAATFRF